MNGDNTLLYELNGVGKKFEGPAESVTVLHSVDLTVEQGDSLAILGASGSGKSTLLHLLGTLDTASWGDISFRGKDIKSLDEIERARVRNREIGFVFQFHHLLSEFSTLENVAMQGIISRMPRDEALEKAQEALAMVGLEQRRDHRVTTLSGGERQRAAIARAILMEPKVLLADEPTGNLDESTGKAVGHLLLQLNRELKTTLVVVTHNLVLAEMMERRLELRSGELYAHSIH